MRLENFEPTLPGKGEVAVKVKIAAINPIDWKVAPVRWKSWRARHFPVRWAWNPVRSSSLIVWF